MRPYSFRCGWFGVHRFDDEDKNSWPACSRCGTRAKIKHDVILESDQVGRFEATASKTKTGKMLPVEKQKPFVRAERR